MYRTLLPLFLYLGVALAAPQDNTDITYVKVQPLTVINPLPTNHTRESRIENIPLTIPSLNPGTKYVNNQTDYLESDVINSQSETTEVLDKSSDQLADVFQSSSSDQSSDLLNQSDNDDVSQSESRFITTTTNYEESETESATENEELVRHTTDYETRTRPPRRFYSKLSYFQKANDYSSSVSTNLVERTGKRKFRSKCRCEKIWNCPKLQISVPRCPEEYFLCCF